MNPCGNPDCVANCEACVAYYDRQGDGPEYRSPADWAALDWSQEGRWVERDLQIKDLREQILRTTSDHRLAARLALSCPVLDEGGQLIFQGLAEVHSRLALAQAMLAQAGMVTARDVRPDLPEPKIEVNPAGLHPTGAWYTARIAELRAQHDEAVQNCPAMVSEREWRKHWQGYRQALDDLAFRW